MGDMPKLGLDDIVEILKAAGEPTRLRLLALLSHGDLTVTDLTDILGQSQPRISRLPRPVDCRVGVRPLFWAPFLLRSRECIRRGVRLARQTYGSSARHVGRSLGDGAQHPLASRDPKGASKRRSRLPR